MEIRTFRTLVGTEFHAVKTGKEVIRNDYILGRIDGFMEAICEYLDQIKYPMRQNINTGEYILTVNCTSEQYEQFKKMVEKRYPGLCKFDV